MSKIAAPCRDCDWRKPGCHAECEGYQNYKREVEKKKAYLKEHECSCYIDFHRKRKRLERREQHAYR